MSDSTYGLHRTLTPTTFEAARDATIAALKAEGFGILSEIDVRATLKAKIDADIRPYTILGACNPPLALAAIGAEPDVGLLLPCNVLLQALDDATVKVSILDPSVMGQVASNDALGPLMAGARERLARALAAI